MSTPITDEQLQTMISDASGKERILLEGIRDRELTIAQRDATIAALKEAGQRIDDELVASEATIAELTKREAAQDVQLAQANCAIAELRESLSAAKSEASEYARENAEFRQQCLAHSPAYDPALIEDADRIEAELSRDQHYGAAQLIPRLLRALRDSQAEVAELRKPVAVEPNETVEKIRAAVAIQRDYVVNRDKLEVMLSAYDTLAQNHAREVNARDAIAAEMRGLRERADKRIQGLEDECWRWRERLLSAEERERQLREGLQPIVSEVRGEWSDELADKLIAALAVSPAPLESKNKSRLYTEDDGTVFLSPDKLCSDCPPLGYPNDKTRCVQCPRRLSALAQPDASKCLAETDADFLHRVIARGDDDGTV